MAMLAACSPGDSHLTVSNRTTQPIVFETHYGDAFIASCSSATFNWNGGWEADGRQRGAIYGAVRVKIITVPPPDGAVSAVVIVASDGISMAPSGASMLLECAGPAPSGAYGG